MVLPRSFSRIAFSLVTLVTGLALCLGPLEPALAQTTENPVPVVGPGFPVAITANIPEAANTTYKNIYSELTRAGVVALTNALQLFLGQMAYDAAEYIATGGKGQGKLFFDGKVGEYLTNVGSDAAGEFMASLSSSNFFQGIGFNLCQPKDPTTLLRLQVSLGDLGRDLFPTPPNVSTGGLTQYNRPRPRCEFQAVLDNYETLYQTMSNGDIIRNLEQGFDPGVSQLGTLTNVYNRFLTDTQRRVTDAAAQREEGNGFRPLEGLISNNVRTPASVIEAATNENVVHKPGADQTSVVNNILSNAWQAGPAQLAMYTGSIFLNTLASKFMQRIFERGLGGGFSSTLSLNLGGPDSVSIYGKTDARNANIDLKNPPPQQVADYDVVSQMQTCLPSQRGVWNCVMDQSLVSAIRANTKEGGITVREAIERGMLHGDWRLIPAARARENQDPQCYTQAYCAGNLQKMRLMRILPVGFEFAANSQANVLRCETPDGCITLKEAASNFSNCNDDGGLDERHPWCHLIDPNWVITIFPQQCVLTGYTDTLVSSKLPIRKEECQDIQTCLARNDKGECTGGFGYCMAERSVYRFSADACPAHAASCRMYTDAASKKVGYLRNTIDRAACDASNAGCLWFATRRATSTAEADAWAANTSTGERIYFKPATANQAAATKGLDACPASEEGCTRLYAFTPGRAALNLMINGSFESQDPTTSTDALAWRIIRETEGLGDGFAGKPPLRMAYLSDQSYLGTKALSLNRDRSPDVLLQQVPVVGGRIHTFSFYAKSGGGSGFVQFMFRPTKGESYTVGTFRAAEIEPLYRKDLTIFSDGQAAAYRRAEVETLSPDWQRFEYYFVLPSSTKTLFFQMNGNNALVDGMQLEEGEYATPYVDTFTEGLRAVFMKIAPDELMCTEKTEEDPTRSPLCDKFAKSCNQLDAGCQGYRDQEAGQEVPAILSENDLCPAVCVGYAEYRKAPSSFDLVKDVDPRFSDPAEATSTYFIPRTAGQCTQQDVGCETFTVVDDSGSQDGGTVAYSYLRACEKPASDSETYFTWEGADTVGYQLRTWSLKRDVGPFDLGPRILTKVQADQISFKEPDTCNEASWRTAADPDCRQFYDARGRMFYRYFSQTVLSSNDCVNLRLARSSSADCERTGGRYNERGECTYGAYLPESRSCSVAAASCRMFTGASAGNMQAAVRQSFRENVAPFEAAGLTTSTEALLVGDVSVRVGDPRPGGDPLEYARARATFNSDELALYRATFWAKAPASSTTLVVRTSREDGGGEAVIGSVRLSPEWQRFTVGLFEGAPDASSTQLTFTGPLVGGTGYGLYLDEVSIVRVQDVVYVRNNTWNTPAQCDQGLDGGEEPQAMLNCRTYQNRLNQSVNARRFTRLCRETAIGCSAFVDTRNTDETYEKKFVQPNPIDPLRHVPTIVKRPADRYVYLIDDPEKRCNKLNMSCRAFGKPKLTPDRQLLDSERPYETVYYKDDVTRYGTAMCQPSEAFCAEYSFGAVKEYFRDPGTSVCEYREAQIISDGEGPAETRLAGWYVKGSAATPCYPDILDGGNAYGMARSGDRSYKGFVGLCDEPAGECTELRDINDVSDPLRRSGKPYYYVKNDRLDTSSCNGTVDLGRGCVLFRDMSSGVMNYNAKATYEKYKAEGFKPVTPVDCRNNPENPACQRTGRCVGTRTTVVRSPRGAPTTLHASDEVAVGIAVMTETLTGTSQCTADEACTNTIVDDPTTFSYRVVTGPSAFDTHTTNTRTVITQTRCTAPRAEQSNDANLLLKVSVDRECSEWLGCRSSETVQDPSTNKYKEICSVSALCDKSTGQPGDQFCASYVDRRSTSTAPIFQEGTVLSADRYANRLLGLGQKDYSGYAIPDAFQVMDLQSVRVAIEGAKNVADAQFRLPQDYRLVAAVAMPPTRLVRVTVRGVPVTRYTHTVRPLANQAKVLGEPENPDPADGLLETHPQLALCKHLATGRIGYFRKNEVGDFVSNRTVYCYLPVHTNSDLLDFQNMAEKFSLADPTTNQFLTQAFPPAECRAHPEQDAPFKAFFTTEWDTTKNPPKAMRRLAGFANANTCELGEDCSCTYKRVDYENAPVSKFYNSYSNASPPGICVGGPREGQGCIPSKIFNMPGNGAGSVVPPRGTDDPPTRRETSPGSRNNAVESANTEQLCGPPEMGGQCMSAKAYTIIRGTFGNCLERDLTRTVGNVKDLTPCLTWNPTLLLNGDKDPYHYNQSAGYLPPQNSGSYYCLSDARKPKSIQFGESNFARSGTGATAKYVGKIFKFNYDDDYVSDGTGAASGNDAGSVISGEKPDGASVADECESTDEDQDEESSNERDDNALRIVNTGRGANRQYAEYFLRVLPDGFVNAYHDGSPPEDPHAREAAVSDNAFAYFGFSPIRTPNATARLACGYNGDWVNDLPATDYDKIDQVATADKVWQNKFNADFKGVLTRSTEKMVTIPGPENQPENERTILRAGCIPTTLTTYTTPPYTGQCFFKTWQTDYRSEGKRAFIGLGSTDPDASGNISPGNRAIRTFEQLRTDPVYSRCESQKPYFSIRAVFQAKADPTLPSPLPMTDAGHISGAWSFAGFWVTACGGAGSTDEHYIYMYPRAEYGDICTELAEVVSRDSHQDAAFTDRVWKDGAFTIPMLGIAYNARYAPFSSALNTRPPGQDPLFQTGQEVAGYSPLNPPTFLAAGYRTYFSTDANPKDKWAYLTNIFARVYRIYRYHGRKVDVTDKACLVGPNKGAYCTTTGQSPECSLNGRCDTTRVARSSTSDFTSLRCNSLSGLNSGQRCLAGELAEACHLAPIQLTDSGQRLRQLPCLTQPGWTKNPDQSWSRSGFLDLPEAERRRPFAEIEAATQGAFRCPGIPASLRREGQRAWTLNGSWDTTLEGGRCTTPTDQGAQITASVECPERIINTLVPITGAPPMTARCERPDGAPPTTAGKCRIVVPPYSVPVGRSSRGEIRPPFEMPVFSVDPLAEGYQYGQCFIDEECAFTQDNYYYRPTIPGASLSGLGTEAPTGPTLFLATFGSTRALWNTSYIRVTDSDYRVRPQAAYEGGAGASIDQYMGALDMDNYFGETGNPRLNRRLVMYEFDPDRTPLIRAPGLPTRTLTSHIAYMIGSCVNPDEATRGRERTVGVCVGGLRNGTACSTLGRDRDADCQVVPPDSRQERDTNVCGVVATGSDSAGWNPVPLCTMADDNVLPSSRTSGVDLNHDNNACTHEQGYVPRSDLCPNSADEYCGLIAYNVRNVADSVTNRDALLPTDVTLGLHKLSYLSNTPETGSSGEPYKSFYPARPPMVAAPDIQSCPTPGKCAVQGMNKFSLNGSSEGVVSVASAQAKTTMRFYAWAAHNQMPLRSVTLDWGDGQKQVIADGKLKNHKPYCDVRRECITVTRTLDSVDKVESQGLTCNTNGDCPVGVGTCQAIGTCKDNPSVLCAADAHCRLDASSRDTCQIRNFFGNTREACEENYFEFTHLYTCGGPSTLPSCSAAIGGGVGAAPSTIPVNTCYFGVWEGLSLEMIGAFGRPSCTAGAGGLAACNTWLASHRLSTDDEVGRTNARTAGVTCVGTGVDPSAPVTTYRCERDPNRTCSTTNPTSCAPGDRCIANLAPAGGCWDSQVQVCRFTPKVMVQDNWGWCTGECRADRDSGGAPRDLRCVSGAGPECAAPTSPIALHPYGGCYSATPLGSDQTVRDNISSVTEPVQFRNECMSNLPDARNSNLRPWVVYPGSVNLRSSR